MYLDGYRPQTPILFRTKQSVETTEGFVNSMFCNSFLSAFTSTSTWTEDKIFFINKKQINET